MVDHNSTTPNPSADADAARARIRQEQEAAGRQFEKGRDALKEQASTMAHDAKEEVRERSEALKGQAADGLKTFADAVRSARDELDKKEMGPISGLVGQAAEGLESLSRSMQNASAGDMIETVRDFGRRNPVSFIAASVLAGIAIGRFAGASAHHERDRGRNPTQRPPQPSRPAPAARAYPAGEAAVTPNRTGDIT
ncbi:hypothetical protein [Aquibium sp. ELW1220]|jgi:predicted  nucleic acid-binding Zn-ribbon protein|uniref:hypothetical protein n=1 Tax=Aquibium sp. ELW1220 TaxID=2976766 RepID=UPI0025AED6A5|nr:hypothetical protein [Aquibium sp. ELW1220]MDN2578486.1 hypothetical protein [Aquibium sp. ELW1220]